MSVNIRPVSLTFEPVHVATISSIVQGVTMTIKPNDIAAIVRDVEPCICGSSSSSVANWDCKEGNRERARLFTSGGRMQCRAEDSIVETVSTCAAWGLENVCVCVCFYIKCQFKKHILRYNQVETHSYSTVLSTYNAYAIKTQRDTFPNAELSRHCVASPILMFRCVPRNKCLFMMTGLINYGIAQHTV